MIELVTIVTATLPSLVSEVLEHGAETSVLGSVPLSFLDLLLSFLPGQIHLDILSKLAQLVHLVITITLLFELEQGSFLQLGAATLNGRSGIELLCREVVNRGHLSLIHFTRRSPAKIQRHATVERVGGSDPSSHFLLLWRNHIYRGRFEAIYQILLDEEIIMPCHRSIKIDQSARAEPHRGIELGRRSCIWRRL